MQISKSVLLFIVSIQFVGSAYAETLKDPAAARQLTDQIMAKVGNGEIDAALVLMKPYIVIPDVELEAARNQASMQLPLMNQRFGKSIGYEFISEDKKGASLLRIVHVHRLERTAMRWAFYFYRTNEGWVLNSFKWDDAMLTMF